MLIAIDHNSIRVPADQAQKDVQCFCPICKQPVIFRHGQVNTAHFAHQVGECTDTWNYDMSEWHRKMQGYFPVKNQEIVIKVGSEIHRADVLVEKTVLEFQHSPITAEEFNARNVFFKNAGYRLAWVFDLRERIKYKQINYLNDDSSNKYKWSNPMRIFSTLNSKFNDNDKQFAVFFQLHDDYDKDDNIYIEKVVWSAGNNYGEVDLSRFVTNDELILGSNGFSIDDMFTPQKILRKRKAKQALNALSKKCEIEKFGFSIKYMGVKGKKHNDYVCPRSLKFGIEVYGENSCTHCQYCYMHITHEEHDSLQHAFYCCYPHPVRKINEPYESHPGYECDSADEYPM